MTRRAVALASQLAPGRRRTPLVRAAASLGGGLDPARRALLRSLDRCLGQTERGSVAVVVGSRPSRLARVVAEAYPRWRVVRVDCSRGPSATHARLAASGPFDVIVDDTRRRRRRADLFRDLFFHLRAGGTFVATSCRSDSRAVRGPETLLQLLQRLADSEPQPAAGGVSAGQPPNGRPRARTRKQRRQERRRDDDLFLASAIRSVTVQHGHVLVTSGLSTLAKLREPEVDTVLRIRAGRSGGVVLRRAPAVLTSKASVRQFPRERPGHRYSTYRAPAVSLRRYADVVCSPGQVVVQGSLLLPDTYRHNRSPRLANVYTEEVAPRFARAKADTSGAVSLDGAYYYLDSEYRGHFGHAMTEQMSRLWAWSEAKRSEPGLRVVLALNKGRRLTEVEAAIFGAAGIPREDLVLVDGPARVETLYAATPMFSMPEYVHPDIEETWRRVGDVLSASAPEREYPRRLFCTRRSWRRLCHNVAEVEAEFADHGFVVVRPEDFPFVEQVRMFREADVVAGFAGSGLFGLCFAETPIRALILQSEGYTATNEYMIASVIGHRLDILWSRPDEPRPDAERVPRRGVAPFVFDFDREGRDLRRILAGL